MNNSETGNITTESNLVEISGYISPETYDLLKQFVQETKPTKGVIEAALVEFLEVRMLSPFGVSGDREVA